MKDKLTEGEKYKIALNNFIAESWEGVVCAPPEFNEKLYEKLDASVADCIKDITAIIKIEDKTTTYAYYKAAQQAEDLIKLTAAIRAGNLSRTDTINNLKLAKIEEEDENVLSKLDLSKLY